MKKVSNEYKKAMNQIIREQAYISVVLAEVNGIAQNDAQFISDGTYFSDGSTPFNTNEQITYATFEKDFTLADGKSKILPREGSGTMLDNGYTSENILGSVTIEFGNTYSIKGLTINFGSGYPTKFKITTDVNSEGTVYTNDSEEFVTTDTIGDISSLTITPITMVGGNQRLRIKRIIMGVGLSYNNEVVESADLSEEISDISEDIPDTQLKVSVLDMENKYNVNNTDSFIDYLTTGQLVTVSFGVALDEDSTEIEWLQTQTLYLSDWSAKNGKFTFSATNIFAQRNDNYTLGNRIYTRTAYDEAVSIFTDLGLEPDDYIIDNYLKSIELTNPMPEDTHANCLLLLCNACRCIFFQDSDGVIHIQGNFALNLEPEDITLTTVGATAYSAPRNVLTSGAVMTHYADFTSNFASADGSFKILPRNSAEYDGNTGFVSKQVSDDNGNFFDNILEPPYDTQIVGNPRLWNGLTFTVNEDGSIHIQGTCTADTWYSFFNNNISRRYMPVEDCPWTKGDVLECDYFLEGTVQGTMGITCGYKTLDSSAEQGYTNYRNLPCNFTNSKYVMSDKKVQTIDPRVDKAGMYWTSYIYIQTGCICDVTLRPMLTVRKTLGNILAHNRYRLGNGGVNNTWTRQGVTYTFLDDGGILVNGTATAESVCELIYPYNSSHRLTLEVGHTYKMSEGRDITTWHRNPFLQLVRYNATSSNYDYTYHTGNNSTIEFTQTNENLVSYGMRIVVASGATADNVVLYPSLIDMDSYDENELNPTTYVYGKKPSLSMQLEAGYVYYGLELNFSGQPPQEVVINTTYNGGAVDNITFTNLQAENYLYADFKMFDTLTVTFTKGAPNTRINVDFVGLGNITDYRLDKDNMTSQLVGTKEELVKDVQVKIYTYENDGDGKPQEVEDDVWYTETLNSTGSHKQISNPLISSNALAKNLAEWLGTHYKNNYSYEVDYRGDPRLNAADIIKLEDEYINNLQVSINKASLKFNGAFSGKLDMRRAMRE